MDLVTGQKRTGRYPILSSFSQFADQAARAAAIARARLGGHRLANPDQALRYDPRLEAHIGTIESLRSGGTGAPA